MSVTPLRPIHRFLPGFPPPQAVVPLQPNAQSLALMLMQEGLLPADVMMQVLTLQDQRHASVADALLARGVISADLLYDAAARHWGVARVNPNSFPPDARLTKQLNHVTALREGLLPWGKIGQATLIVTAYPENFHRHRAWLQDRFGTVAMAVAPIAQIESALLKIHGPRLVRAAETRVDATESCRSFHAESLQIPAILLLGVVGLVTIFQPLAVILSLYLIAFTASFSASVLKAAAFFHMRKPNAVMVNPPIIAHQPIVSVMVALYRESNIAGRLAARLERLEYPRELLDILLVVEEEDRLTRDALAHADLPGWMRVVVVPNGAVKTKPRALNYALDHCRGSIIGIYDAEDAPEPDQIRKVVDRFHQRGPEVVCLQGRLDFYNPKTNWIARCFTIEYASWFRLFLPGIERMGLAIPLGGTTLFFRRRALEELGGWDAQNVTEDADLGIRLFRHGYRTELIETTTFEEANCRSFPWIKQRSRWIKGYMMTWLTHMRDPSLLLQQLGLWRFIGFQVQFLGSILQALLAPLLWSLWLIPIGVAHPLVTSLSVNAFGGLYFLMLITMFLGIGFDIEGLKRSNHKMNPLWVISLTIYHPLATFAAYKALWEMLTKPFYWDKTSHGHFDLH
jgi:cellulose synthase/poly-beta-1,6-N-acetylglucosamine synthase-like glycosyltransferase